MSNKIPCGGFYLDDMLNVNDSGELSIKGGVPYQQLVTDGEGNTKWEDRLAYDDSKVIVGPLKDGTSLAKVADEIPGFVAAGEAVNIYLSIGQELHCEIRDLDFNPDVSSSVPYAADTWVVFIAENNQTTYLNSNELTFPQKGVYFLFSEGEFYVSGFSRSTSDTPEITWDGNVGMLKTIDPKYIPSELNEVILPSSTSGSSKRFKITVDDTGTISATEVT